MYVEVGGQAVAERLIDDELNEARAALDSLHGAQREKQVDKSEELLGGQRRRGWTREKTLALADDECLQVGRPLFGRQLRHARLHELYCSGANNVVLLVATRLRLSQRCVRKKNNGGNVLQSGPRKMANTCTKNKFRITKLNLVEDSRKSSATVETQKIH